MIIVIEGVDGSGKTTLANQISSQAGFEVIHRSKPETNEERLNMLQMYRAIIASGKDIILDRSWYSEVVYGQVMRDISFISIEQMKQLENELANVGGLVIYCTGDVDKLWQRACLRGESYITDYRDFTALALYYESLFTMPHKIPVVRYAINDDTSTQI